MSLALLVGLFLLTQVPASDTQHSDMATDTRPFILDQKRTKILKTLPSPAQHSCGKLNTSTQVSTSSSNIGLQWSGTPPPPPFCYSHIYHQEIPCFQALLSCLSLSPIVNPIGLRSAPLVKLILHLFFPYAVY